MATKQIGWFNLKEDKVFTNTYECAAWYENVKVPAGRYPIVVYDYKVMHFEDEARKRFNGEVDGHIRSAYISMDGIITSDEFGARFCGVPVGSYDNHQNTGKRSSHTMHVYLYSLADSVLNDPETPYELLPEYRAEEERFVSSFDGKEFTTHCIRLAE